MTVVEQQTADKKWGKRRPITFISKGKFHTVIRRGEHKRVHPETGEVQYVSGLRYEFEPDGVLTVYPGEDVAMDGPVDPETGYRTEVDKAAWLRSHNGFNQNYWEIGNEPDAMRPSVEEMLREITQAAVLVDLDRLKELRRSEDETHQRQTVIGAIDDALDAAMAAIEEHTQEEGS